MKDHQAHPTHARDETLTLPVYRTIVTSLAISRLHYRSVILVPWKTITVSLDDASLASLLFLIVVTYEYIVTMPNQTMQPKCV